ncbi:unnamed protein product [Alopecurus aequalis]
MSDGGGVRLSDSDGGGWSSCSGGGGRPSASSTGVSLRIEPFTAPALSSYESTSGARVFEVRCLHIPLHDRTPFEGLLQIVEEYVKYENALSPNRPIYITGDSFGGCLAISVAARNPETDLVLTLVNPATSSAKASLQAILPVLETVPSNLPVIHPHLLSYLIGNPLDMAMVSVHNNLSPQETLQELSDSLTSMLHLVLEPGAVIRMGTLVWKLKLLMSGAAYANSQLDAVQAEVLLLASGTENLPPSGEAERLSKTMKNCKVRYFRSRGDRLLMVPIDYQAHHSSNKLFKNTCGVREALHRKGEAYKLFWPDQPEFVRMAARFGVTVIPFGCVGEDDFLEIILDYNDEKNIPYLREGIKSFNEDFTGIRDTVKGEDGNQVLHLPVVLPKVPGRLYFLFGKPIEMNGMDNVLTDRKNTNQVNLHIKSEAENLVSYLKRKRHEDPYRSITRRMFYQATWGPSAQVPTFEP